MTAVQYMCGTIQFRSAQMAVPASCMRAQTSPLTWLSTPWNNLGVMQEASPSGRGAAKGGPVPTRRALFSTCVQEADSWSVAASRNLDAPEMGSPPSSDDDEDDDDDDSSSGSSSEVSKGIPLVTLLMCLLSLARLTWAVWHCWTQFNQPALSELNMM